MHTIISYVRLVCFLITTLPDLSRVKRLRKKGDEKYRKYVNRQYKRAITKIPKILGVTMTVTGEENIIRDKAAIYVSNHQSYPDPIFIFKPLGFICPVLCKKEILKIPVVSAWLKAFDCVFVDRDDARSAINSLKEASELVNAGNSMIIFPEGTRSYGYEVGEYKAGAFKIAEKTRAPIIPVRLHNACDVMRRGSAKLKKATVKIDFLAPIDISEMSKKELRELPEKIQELVASGIEGVKNEQ